MTMVDHPLLAALEAAAVGLDSDTRAAIVEHLDSQESMTGRIGVGRPSDI